MSLTPEEIERRTFRMVDGGYDPHEVVAFLREVASDYRTMLDLVITIIEAAGEESDDPSVRVLVRSRADRRQLKRARDEAARILAEARIDADDLMQEAFARIDRVLAVEAGMREQLRMAKKGIEALETEVQWPEWLGQSGARREPLDAGPDAPVNPLDE